jgi:hypothetical protein
MQGADVALGLHRTVQGHSDNGAVHGINYQVVRGPVQHVCGGGAKHADGIVQDLEGFHIIIIAQDFVDTTEAAIHNRGGNVGQMGGDKGSHAAGARGAVKKEGNKELIFFWYCVSRA